MLFRSHASWASWRGRAIEPHVNEALNRLGATHPELAGVQQAGPWWNRDNSLEVDMVACTAEDIATVGTIKWRPRVAVNRTEMAELAGARNVTPMPAVRVSTRSAPAGLPPVPAPTSLCAPKTCWPHGMPESASRDAVAAVPQRSTATPPLRPAIQRAWVPSSRAQPPPWLRLREVRDEEAAGSNPVTPTSVPAGHP